MQFFQVLFIPILAYIPELLSLLESQKSDFVRHERGAGGAIFSKGETRRHGARVSEERRDRLLAVTELHLFGPSSKKVIFFQGGNFETSTVTAPCRKRAALCPRLSLPSSHPPRFAALFLFFSRLYREYKHLATAGRQKFGLREPEERVGGGRADLFLVRFACADKTKETYEGP